MAVTELLSTELDVYNKVVMVVSDTGEHAGTWERSKEAIRNTIATTDGIIRTVLKLVYSTTLTSASAIDCGFPQPWSGNSGTGTIRLATANTTNTITQLFTLTYESTTYESTGSYYTCVGSITGSDGNSYVASDFTGSYLSILSTYHGGSPSDTDVIFIPTYKNERMLVEISSSLAASAILQSLYIAENPNAEDFSQRLKESALDMLKTLVDPNSNTELITVARTSRNINPIQVDYEIDEIGNDVTNYAAREWSSVVGSIPWWG